MKYDARVVERSAAVPAGASVPQERPGKAGASGSPAGERSTVRDRLWIWGQPAGSLDNEHNLPGSSRMSAAEGAYYLDVPNVVMSSFPSTEAFCKAAPMPPDRMYLVSFRPLKRVVWSIGNFGTDKRVRRAFVGRSTARDVKTVWELAAHFPNIVGAHLDIFFRDSLGGRRTSALALEDLDYVRNELGLAKPRLDFWAALYRRDLDYNPSPYLAKVDVITYWTPRATDLERLEEGFSGLERAAPGKKKLLGCGMWDFDEGKPLPVPLMEKQCRLGLDWLRKGRIEGIVFRASPLCDMNIDAVEWTRAWIRKVRNEKI